MKSLCPNILILFSLLSLIGCGGVSPSGGRPPQEVTVSYQAIPEGISEDDVNFANTRCSYYARQSPANKKRCREVIDALCSHIDIRSDEVENLPLWRPDEPPASYFRALKARNGGNLSRKGQNHFVCSVYAYLYEEFQAVLELRKEVIDLMHKNNRGSITEEERQRHKQISIDHDYNQQLVFWELDKKHPRTKERLQPDDLDPYEDLVRKIDVVPVSLMLVIAAHESGFGTSRKSLVAQNLWGRTGTKSCDSCVRSKDPRRRGETFLRYSNFESAVADQYFYFNRLYLLRDFRDARHEMRQFGFELSSFDLANYLMSYNSEDVDPDTKRWIYNEKLQSYLRGPRYSLEKYDVFDVYINPRTIGSPHAK